MTDLFLAGLELMLLGMGIVFSFLILLVFTLHAMTWLAGKIYQPPVEQKKQGMLVTDQGTVSDVHLAVISAAIARYRAQKQT